ncbi:hypothetical protein [Agromyces silvae]|uniref:hypothetical protein n=1 Tax=Agromyces silvae TaxID=3388266 RepID=UPI00280B269A|nr:hypothetical protein [Agromyces protaetiae]
MNITLAMLAGALTASLSFGPPTPTAELAKAAAIGDPETIERVAHRADFGVLASHPFGLVQCPSHRPNHIDHEFHKNSGWGIPRGVEIRAPHALVVATALATYRGTADGWVHPSGIASAFITNAGTAQSISIVLHCTRRPR